MRRLVPLLFSAALLAGCPSEGETEPTPAAPAMINAFNDAGPFGMNVRDTAEDWDFDCRTHDDEYDFKDRWDGAENHVVVQTISSSTMDLWSSDFREFLDWSPPNVHYFFVSARPDFDADYDGLEARIDAALDDLDEDDAEYGREHWQPRLHVARAGRDDVGGLVERVLETWPNSNAEEGSLGWSWQGFGIDRFQRLREIGLTRVVADPPRPNQLWFVAHNPRHYNFEYEREVEMRASPADLTIPLWTGEQVGGGGRDSVVQLPSPEELASYDTLEVDLTMGCPDGGADRSCWEWDYKAHMSVCEAAIEEPDLSQECQYEVKDEAGEVITPADVAPCPCSKPRGGVAERTRTCRAVVEEEVVVGSEWSACACRCDGEMARWITSYHRHGRWVTDITPSLAMLQGGGLQRFRFQTSYNYEMKADLLLSKRGRADRPFAYVPLWDGGGFGAGYNDAHAPIEFEVPAGAVRAEIVAWITGHGFAGDDANCAEFCPHHHTFSVNGGTGHTRGYDEADDWLGCIDQIDDGALPNQ